MFPVSSSSQSVLRVSPECATEGCGVGRATEGCWCVGEQGEIVECATVGCAGVPCGVGRGRVEENRGVECATLGCGVGRGRAREIVAKGVRGGASFSCGLGVFVGRGFFL